MADIADATVGMVPGPTDEVVRAALARVLSSDAFRSAPQLSSFLTYVVERTLEGRAQEIKGYTIATEALGRDPDFDPQADPIVRVEAMRLRRALDAYYAEAGNDDCLRIEIPRGSYVPQFAAREAAPPPQAARAAWWRGLGTHRHGLLIAGGVAMVALAVVLLAGVPWRPAVSSSPVQPVHDTARGALPPAASLILPAVQLDAVEVSGAIPAWFATSALTSGLLDALARFDEVRVVDNTRGALPEASARAAAGEQRYRLTVRVANALDLVGVTVRLIHVGSGAVVWVREFKPLQGPSNPGSEAELALARSIATTIAQPYGVIFADLRNRTTTSPEWRCLSAAYDYWRAPTEAMHATVRDCLEALADEHAGLASAYANVTYFYLEEYRAGYNRRARPSPIERALTAARKAVELAPESARAYQALMDAQFIRGDYGDALAAGHHALARNPYDTDIQADLGARYVARGRYAEGVPLLEQAAANNPAHPPWVDFYLFVAAHMTNNADAARRAASRIVGDDYSLGLVARAIVADADGDVAKARQALERLVVIEPRAAKELRAIFVRRGFSSEIVARLADDLAAAGLSVAVRAQP